MCVSVRLNEESDLGVGRIIARLKWLPFGEIKKERLSFDQGLEVFPRLPPRITLSGYSIDSSI